VICTNAETGLIIGSPSILPGRQDRQQAVNAEQARGSAVPYRLALSAMAIQPHPIALQIFARPPTIVHPPAVDGQDATT